MDYNAAFEKAIVSFMRIYQTGTYAPATEADIQAYIFSLCISTCQEYGLPLDIHCNCKNEFLDSTGRRKADLILGNSVVVEFKFEADYPGVSKPVVFPREAAADVERLQAMKSSGFPHCHFIFLDEDGTHYRNFRKYVDFSPSWNVMEREHRTSYILHKYF